MFLVTGGTGTLGGSWCRSYAAQAVRDGANLAPGSAVNRAVGRRTWEEFLAERAGR